MGVSKMDSAKSYNSWKPYQYYLYNGNYPLRRTIYALLNDTRNGVPSGFAHFVQLPKGQKIILRAGLLPRSANMNVRDVIVNKEWLNFLDDQTSYKQRRWKYQYMYNLKNENYENN